MQVGRTVGEGKFGHAGAALEVARGAKKNKAHTVGRKLAFAAACADALYLLEAVATDVGDANHAACKLRVCERSTKALTSSRCHWRRQRGRECY